MPGPGPRPQVEIDEDLCVGTGECVRLAPRAFSLESSEGIAEVLPTVSDTPVDDLVDAVRSCPTQAITVTDEHGEPLA